MRSFGHRSIRALPDERYASRSSKVLSPHVGSAEADVFAHGDIELGTAARDGVVHAQPVMPQQQRNRDRIAVTQDHIRAAASAIGAVAGQTTDRRGSAQAFSYARRRFAAVFLRVLEAERAAARFTGF